MKVLKSPLAYIILTIFVIAFMIVIPASANPLRFGTIMKSATATSTVSYMTAGAATTTSPTLDAYAQPSGFALDRATLLVQYGASSTASILDINVEYSQDGVDWFEDGGNVNFESSTTTRPFFLTEVSKFRLSFASSTPGGMATAGDATTTRAVIVETPTRYVRAVFTVPVGAADGNVWSAWVPIRETSE